MLWLQTLGFSVRTCKTLSPPKGKQRCGNSPQRINRIIAGHIVKRFFVLDGINASPCIRDDCVNWSTAYSVTLNIASGPQRTMTRQGCVPIHQVTSEERHSGQHLQVLSLSSQEINVGAGWLWVQQQNQGEAFCLCLSPSAPDWGSPSLREDTPPLTMQKFVCSSFFTIYSIHKLSQ